MRKTYLTHNAEFNEADQIFQQNCFEATTLTVFECNVLVVDLDSERCAVLLAQHLKRYNRSFDNTAATSTRRTLHDTKFGCPHRVPHKERSSVSLLLRPHQLAVLLVQMKLDDRMILHPVTQDSAVKLFCRHTMHKTA